MIAQQELFNLKDKEITKPQDRPCYDLDDVPMHLLTAQEWLADGFKVNPHKIEGYVWDNEWTPLYSSKTTKPVRRKVLHMPSISDQIAQINAKITAKEDEIEEWKNERRLALKYKARSTSEEEKAYHNRVLSNACGRMIDCIDMRDALLKDRKRLETTQKKNR